MLEPHEHAMFGPVVEGREKRNLRCILTKIRPREAISVRYSRRTRPGETAKNRREVKQVASWKPHKAQLQQPTTSLVFRRCEFPECACIKPGAGKLHHYIIRAFLQHVFVQTLVYLSNL